MINWLLPAAMAGSPEIITLSGSSGTPNQANATVVAPGTVTAGWRVLANGQIQRTTGISNIYSAFNIGTEWSNKNPPGTYYIRATLDSGTTPDSGTLNTWIEIDTTITWSWTRSAVGVTTGILELEIATDSGGTNIVASGFYRGQAEIDSGS